MSGLKLCDTQQALRPLIISEGTDGVRILGVQRYQLDADARGTRTLPNSTLAIYATGTGRNGKRN